MIVALNNKCNLNKNEFISYLKELENINTNHEMILCPSFLNIALFNNESNIKLAAQNVSENLNGAHTGEVSAEQLKSFDVEYCIIGHSERRKDQKEANEEIANKMERLIEEGIIPILCVGETKEERENSKEKEIIKQELEIAFSKINYEDTKKVIIAYEPIWSIGTGIIPTNEQINDIFKFIKDNYPEIKVLYGGSANENNIETLKECKDIDGYLLGGLSLKPSKLSEFVNKM